MESHVPLRDTRMTATAILIDFDGVLRHWPANDLAVERAHGLPPGSIRHAAFDRRVLAALVEGRLSDTQWHTETARRLREQHAGAAVDAAVAAWSAGIGEIDHAMLDLLQSCLPTPRLVLVSNGSTRLPQDLAAHGITAQFHAIVNSSELGVAKPAAAFFEAALARAGVTAQQAVFIDDSTEHVTAARRRGIRSHVYRGLHDAREFLRECGFAVAG